MKSRPEAGSIPFFVILATVSALGPFSIDMYLPALPAMSDALQSTPALMQMTITAYLIGFAVGPLFLAPLSDSWGRKRTQTVFLLIFAAVSLGCAFATSAEALIVLRAAQAIAAGAAMTTARAILSDLYEGDALSRASSILMMIFTIAPVVAPITGAWLLELTGWEGIFVSLVLVGLGSAFLIRLLPETLAPERRQPYAPRAVIAGYRDIMSQRSALRYLGSIFFFGFMFFAMLTASPFIFIDHFGVSPYTFSAIFAVSSASAVFGNIINTRLVFRIGYDGMLRNATYGLIIVSGIMALIAFTGLGGVWGFFLVMLALMALFQVSIANGTAGIMSIARHRAGSASAAMAFWRFTGGTLGSFVVSAFNTDHPWPFALALGIAAAGAITVITIWRADAPEET